MAKEKYASFAEFKKDFEKDHFMIKTTSGIELSNLFYEMPVEEQLASFHLVHQSREILHEQNLAYLKENPVSKDEERHLRHLQHVEEGLQSSRKNLEVIAEITRLFHNDEQLPFEKNKTYKISTWKHVFCGGTGEWITCIKSPKLKVLENSKFQNAYHSFILGITSHPFPQDKSCIPFVYVKPSYGRWKSGLYIRMDMIETA